MSKKKNCVRFHRARQKWMFLIAPPCWKERLIRMIQQELAIGHALASMAGDISMEDQYATALKHVGVSILEDDEEDC